MRNVINPLWIGIMWIIAYLRFALPFSPLSLPSISVSLLSFVSPNFHFSGCRPFRRFDCCWRSYCFRLHCSTNSRRYVTLMVWHRFLCSATPIYLEYFSVWSVPLWRSDQVVSDSMVSPRPAMAHFRVNSTFVCTRRICSIHGVDTCQMKMEQKKLKAFIVSQLLMGGLYGPNKRFIYRRRGLFIMCAGEAIGTLVGLRNSFIGGKRFCISFKRPLFV